ncbi:MAG: complex I NDUFA9 subunit family protein [Aquificae bacterium]|nr:complex I NDUFA9 subunit family protein [Aquificota bacterium]
MRVAVTGGTGFVGRYVVKELLARGHEPLLLVRNPEKARKLFGSSVEVEKTDFTLKDLLRVFKERPPSAVVHLIGILYERPSEGQTFEEVHARLTKTLVEAAKEASVNRFLFMSALGTDDGAPSRYHRTKREAEKAVINSGITYAIFRPSLILGPEQLLFRELYKLTRFLPIVVLPGGGNFPFQPVDVRDVACAFATALESEKAENKVIELCGDKVVTLKQLLQDTFRFWNRRVLILPAPAALLKLVAPLVERLLYPPPFSSDQLKMMWRPNVCGSSPDAVSNGVKYLCGRDPIPYEESLRWSLTEFQKVVK